MASIELGKVGEEPPPSPSSSATTNMAGGCLCYRRQWAKLRFKMKKLFGRKSKDEEPQADSSFGRNNRPPQSNNPYAQNADPYANNAQSYDVNSQSSFRSTQSGSSTAARPGLPSGLPSGPRPGGLPRQQPPRLPSYDSDPPQYPSSAKTGSGYGDAKVGNSAGYGANRYNAGAATFNNQYSATSGPGNGYPTQRSGGYGGLDESPQNSQGSAPPRYSPPRPSGGWDSTPSVPGQPNNNDDSRTGRSYGYGESRELTEEEQEEAEVNDTKQQITEELRAGNRSLGNAVGMTRDMVSRFGDMENMVDQHGESLDNTHRNLVRGNAATRIGSSGVKELGTLAKTPFFIPAMSSKKKREQESARMMGEQAELEEKEEARLNSYGAYARKQMANDASSGPKLLGARSNVKNYSFEDETGEQENLVNEGDDMMEELSGNLSILKTGLTRMGGKVDKQNSQIEQMAEKATDAELKVRKNKMMLDRIH